MEPKLRWSLIVSAMALAACGGDGDNDEPVSSAPPPATAPAPPPPTFYNANAAYLNLATQSRTWDMKGTNSDGHDYRYIFDQAPGEDAPFPLNGVVGATLNVTVQVAEDDEELSDPALNASTTWFTLTNAVEMGLVNYTLGEVDSCYSNSDGQVPPTSVRVGDRGGLFNYELFGTANGRCRARMALETGRANWSLEKIDDTIFFCRLNSGSVVNPASTYTYKRCYETDADGKLGERSSLDYATSSAGSTYTLTLKNY